MNSEEAFNKGYDLALRHVLKLAKGKQKKSQYVAILGEKEKCLKTLRKSPR
jgi:hypothetical protein